MEPVIAYALADVSFSHQPDPYELQGLPKSKLARNKIKKALLVCLNTGNQASATGAVKNALYEDYATALRKENRHNEVMPFDAVDDWDLLWVGSPSIDDIVERLFKKHSAILPSSKKKGLYRMFVESQVTAEVMRKLEAKGIVVLPVHDSFVVHPEHIDELDLAMTESLIEVTGTDFIGTTLESNAIERSLVPQGSPNLGPPGCETPDCAESNLYPWDVSEDDYRIFFEQWRAHSDDYRALMEDLRKKRGRAAP